MDVRAVEAQEPERHADKLTVVERPRHEASRVCERAQERRGASGSPSSQMRSIRSDADSTSASVSSARTATPARAAAPFAIWKACSRTSAPTGVASSCTCSICTMVPRANRPSTVGPHKLRGETLASPPKRGCRRKTENRGMRDPSPTLVRQLGGRVPEILDALEALVAVESPSSEPSACAACAHVADELGKHLLGARAERHVVDGRTHLRWRFGTPRILLSGHLDTVWPLGTFARWPFRREDKVATGPGVFDMKAGVVQLLFSLAALDDLDGVCVLLTTDEEIGAPTSGALIDETAAGMTAALVLEPSAHGALKTERKGISVFRITVSGRAAHAGLEPESGANAAVELAHQLLAVAGHSSPESGHNCDAEPRGCGHGGEHSSGRGHGACRRPNADWGRGRPDPERIRLARARRPGTSLAVEETVSVPPLERAASAELFARAQRIASALGLEAARRKPPSAAVATGAGSPAWAFRHSTGSGPWATTRTPRASSWTWASIWSGRHSSPRSRRSSSADTRCWRHTIGPVSFGVRATMPVARRLAVLA